MPMPTTVKQLRSLLGGLSYYRSFLKNLSKRVKPLTALLKKGARFDFTPEMDKIVRSLLKELSEPPVLVFPDWDAIADGSRPLILYCDASTSTDGIGATLEQKQADGSIRPIVFISRATLDAECNWTPLDLEAGAIVWAICEDICAVPRFRSFQITKRLKTSPKSAITTRGCNAG